MRFEKFKLFEKKGLEIKGLRILGSQNFSGQSQSLKILRSEIFGVCLFRPGISGIRIRDRSTESWKNGIFEIKLGTVFLKTGIPGLTFTGLFHADPA